MPRLMSVLVLTLVFNLSPNRTIAQDGKQQTESKQLSQIRFHEVKFVSDEPLPPVADKIRAALQALQPELNRGGIDEFLERARYAWQQEGYFKVEVSRPEFKPAGGDSDVIDATVHVTPGLQYKTGEITFRNNTRFTASQLRSMMPINRGEIFDTHKIGNGIEAMRQAYAEQGFINFVAIPMTSIDDMNSSVSLNLDLDEGSQFHVRKFEIVGLDAVKAQALLETSGLAPGSVFNSKLLSEVCPKNESELPAGATARDCDRVVDDRAAVVDLKIEFANGGPGKNH
jgi:outer membrane protein assembly factor BamA